MNAVLQAIANGLMIGGFYALMGMGQNVIFGVMKIINFCHGEMLMVGMYLTFTLCLFLRIDPYMAVPIVAIIMFLLGALLQETLITPSLGTKSFTNLLFLTVGLGTLLQNLALVIFGSSFRTIATSYSTNTVHLGPVTVGLPKLISFIVSMVITVVLFAFLKYTNTGKELSIFTGLPMASAVHWPVWLVRCSHCFMYFLRQPAVLSRSVLSSS